MGSDMQRLRENHIQRRFNPRSRMGSDGKSEVEILPEKGFNPRSRMGSDNFRKYIYIRGNVSIHAPVWGATWLSG